MSTRRTPNGSSPLMQPRVSPTISPGLPKRDSPGLPPAPNSTGTFRPPAPLSLGDSAIASMPAGSDKNGRRVDPTKFKTDLCRNWEQTGSCSFKGCTFAHGQEELRPVQRPQGSIPQPLSPQAYVEHLSKLLLSEVSRESHIYSDHQESNRKLEQQLREEQSKRQQLLKELNTAEQEYRKLCDESDEKDKIISTLRRQLHYSSVSIPSDIGSKSYRGLGGNDVDADDSRVEEQVRSVLDQLQLTTSPSKR